MSAPKYTPGPWDACEDEPSIGSYRGGIACHIAACGMEQAHGHHIPLDEAYANARLIAAAPELLEAARQADCPCSASDEHTPGCWMPAIHAAIAKAEGRT